MSSAAPASPKKTPLHARHRAAGARMVEYAGWDMPVEYAGIAQEHLAVRTHAGVFDVSHMGEIEIAGPDALDLVQWLTSNDASRLAIGQIQYSALTTDTGTFVDDLLVYRLADAHFLLVVNAANISAKDYEWMVAQARHRAGDRAVVNCSSRYALIALQGPAAQPILQTLTAIDLPAIRYYWFAAGEVAGVRVTVSPSPVTPKVQAVSRFTSSAAGVGRKTLGRRADRGEALRRRAMRPRRARHPAPRSRDAAVRQRHGCRDVGARSRTRSGSSGWKKPRLPRIRAASRADGRAP